MFCKSVEIASVIVRFPHIKFFKNLDIINLASLMCKCFTCVNATSFIDFYFLTYIASQHAVCYDCSAFIQNLDINFIIITLVVFTQQLSVKFQNFFTDVIIYFFFVNCDVLINSVSV